LSARKTFLRLLRAVSFFDVTIRHPLAKSKLKLHPFKHKGYWFHGANREASELRWFERLVEPGDCVWEVGAHIGFVTQWFSKLVGENGLVIAFEPGPSNLEYLRKNVSELANARVEAVAVCDQDGSVSLNVEDLSGQNNSLIDNLPVLEANTRAAGVQPRLSKLTVQALSLDSFRSSQRRRANFIKIDVEGAEYQVLVGARETLKSDRPILMVELMMEPRRSLDFLKELGYRCFYVNGVEAFRENLPEAFFTNVFALPADAPQVKLFEDFVKNGS
jgi:FkbM family methyltransferase